jgi:cytochrome c biogenesis protein CcmG/thiol:disulfide interchange protein DsbE
LSERRRRSLPLLLVVGLFALAAGALVVSRPSVEPPLRAGAAAPAFRLDSLDGGTLALEESRGRVVFVNFWATWCPPCRDEAPGLERLYRELRDEGFDLLAVSIDAPDAREKVEAFRGEFGLSFPILFDPDRRVYEAFQATGVPETFLVNRRGEIVERFVGPRDWEQSRYAAAIRRLLTESGADSADLSYPVGSPPRLARVGLLAEGGAR